MCDGGDADLRHSLDKWRHCNTQAADHEAAACARVYLGIDGRQAQAAPSAGVFTQSSDMSPSMHHRCAKTENEVIWHSAIFAPTAGKRSQLDLVYADAGPHDWLPLEYAHRATPL